MAKLLTEEEYAELLADAERYRYLRENACNHYEDGDGVQLVSASTPDWNCETGEGVKDGFKAIDNALDKQRGVK